MIKAILSMLSLVALSFTAFGCVAEPTDPNKGAGEESVGDEESVAEAQAALTILDCCTKYDSLSSSEKQGCDIYVPTRCASDGSVQYCKYRTSPGAPATNNVPCPNYVSGP